MDALQLIRKYYEPGSKAYYMLVGHGKAVAEKALSIAGGVRHFGPDEAFIEEAAMIHDIGIFMTDAPEIGCFGEREYICHGYLGRELLEREGLPRHALVCERHVGVGLTVMAIAEYRLPVPPRDMTPLSIEEKIICYADKFFSKKPGALSEEKSLGQIRASIGRYGTDKLAAFEELHSLFSR